eukprot:s951_g3.t1
MMMLLGDGQFSKHRTLGVVLFMTMSQRWLMVENMHKVIPKCFPIPKCLNHQSADDGILPSPSLHTSWWPQSEFIADRRSSNESLGCCLDSTILQRL